MRVGKWKYVHYAKYGPQLFDLDQDPEETRDLAADPVPVVAGNNGNSGIFIAAGGALVTSRGGVRMKKTKLPPRIKALKLGS